MKKLFIFSILILLVCALFAQERTVNLGIIDLKTTKNVPYNGTTNDRLVPTSRDTIDYTVTFSNYDAGPIHWYANFTLDTIAGADTTISVTVLGKKMASETAWATLKAAATSSAVSAELQVSNTSFAINAVDTTSLKNYTSEKLNTLLYNKYMNFRLILKGNDHTGTGIRVKRVELQFFQ